MVLPSAAHDKKSGGVPRDPLAPSSKHARLSERSARAKANWRHRQNKKVAKRRARVAKQVFGDAHLFAAVAQTMLFAQQVLYQPYKPPRPSQPARDACQGDVARAAWDMKFDAVAYLLLRPTLKIGGTTLRDLIDAGEKTCAGLHTEILRGEQVENVMALLDERGCLIDGPPRFSTTQAQRTAALVDRVNKEGCVEVGGDEEISMWLVYSADPQANGANKVVGKFTVHKLASVDWARRHCDPSRADGSWVEYAVDELGAPGAARLCVVGCLHRISAATPVFLGRDGSHRDGGPHKMALRNFAEQAREQGGVLRLDATSQRVRTGDADAEKEEGEV
jgi:hypothetical protein